MPENDCLSRPPSPFIISVFICHTARCAPIDCERFAYFNPETGIFASSTSLAGELTGCIDSDGKPVKQ